MPALQRNSKPSQYWLPFILLSLFVHFGGLQIFSRPPQRATAEMPAQAQAQTGMVSVDFVESRERRSIGIKNTPSETSGGAKEKSSSGISAHTQGVEGAKLAGSLLPQYPRAARERGESGIVELKLQVDSNGNVAVAAVEKSSGYTRLDQAALAAVKDARFFPAQENGKAVVSSTQLRISFQLNGATAVGD